MSPSPFPSLQARALRVPMPTLASVGIVFILFLMAGFSAGFHATTLSPPPGSRVEPSVVATAAPSPFPLRAQTRGGDNDNNNDNDDNDNSGVRFRCGRADDAPLIAFTMARELMNPLGISHTNFVVAEDVSSGDRVGWAQIRPLGPAAVDPSEFDSPPGSSSGSNAISNAISNFRGSSVEDDVDEMMWEEFENDPRTEFSGGRWQNTLPWTKEYKEAFDASDERLQRRAELVALEEERRRNQIEPRLWELASVYVVPERRSEGIGRDLVRSVLDQHKELGRARESVYALTLSSTVDWYRSNFGFVPVTEPGEIPKPMALEVAAGKIITKLMGNELVCLRMPLESMLQ